MSVRRIPPVFPNGRAGKRHGSHQGDSGRDGEEDERDVVWPGGQAGCESSPRRRADRRRLAYHPGEHRVEERQRAPICCPDSGSRVAASVDADDR
jgi:hypothetical protein